jgi:hypothetical protein
MAMSPSTGSSVRRTDWIVLAAIVAASSAWCLTASPRIGATFDEPFYLQAGLDYWRHGHFGQLLAAGTMPLAPHLQTVPVFLTEWVSGRTLTIESDLGEMLQLARPVTLLFWVILLGYTMRLGRLFGGSWGGRFAAALVAMEPNFLAHASLATTDIALAACFVAFVVQLLDGHGGSPWRRIGLPAIWFGLAVTAKVSALALLPFAAAIVLLREPHDSPARRRLGMDLIAILAIGLAFTVLYCGTGGQTWLHNTLARMPGGHWLRPLVSWLGSLPLFPNAPYAMWFQFAHNQTGQAVFIAGLTGTQAIWFYVPVLLTIKLTVPVIAVMILAVGISRSRGRTIVVFVAMLLAAMAIFRVQTGVRFLLPLLAVAIAWAASALSALVARPRNIRLALAAIVTAILVEAAMVWPDGIRYVNALWGGTAHGYRVVSDSNYDWGQGLPELSEWQRAHGTPLAVWYFGTDTRFPEISRINPRLDTFNTQQLEGRALAVSTSLLYGGYLETPGPARDLIQRLRATPPMAQTATFFIFAPASP